MMKPSGCHACPNFKETTFEVGVGASPCDVLFLGEAPPPWGGVFNDNAGRLVKHMITKLANSERVSGSINGPLQAMAARSHYMYGACCPGKNTKEVFDACASSVVYQKVHSLDPKVIVCFGSRALNGLGLDAKAEEIRGRIITVQVAGRPFKVMPTFSLARLSVKPGLYSLVENDLKKAAVAAAGSSAEGLDVPKLIEGFDIPATLEEAIAICEEYANYSAGDKPAKQCMMALDFETTTLWQWSKTARIIALSGSVGPGKSFAVPVDHKDSPYEFHEIIPWILKVLGCENPKTWWNYKFDYSMALYPLMLRTAEACALHPGLEETIEEVSGMSMDYMLSEGPVRNTKWDGMLGEHMLDEDKKTFYSLKTVVVEDHPELVGYESSLKEELDKASDREFEASFSRVASTDPNEVEGLYYPDTSPIGHGFDLTTAEAASKKYVAKLRKMKKGQSAENKQAIDGAIAAIKEWASECKKELSAAKAGLKKFFTHRNRHRWDGNPHYDGVTYEEPPMQMMLEYAAVDADLTWRISFAQRRKAWFEHPPNKARAEGNAPMISLMSRHYLPATEMLAQMQYEGIRVDPEHLEYCQRSLEAKVQEWSEAFYARVHRDLNLTTDTIDIQEKLLVSKVFIAGYGLPRVKTTETGEASADEESLKEYRRLLLARDVEDYCQKNSIEEATAEIEEELLSNNPADLLLKVRKASKALTTFVLGIKKGSAYDGRLRGTIHINGTATGRTSSSNPNMQTFPKKLGGINIKKLFVPTDTSPGASATEVALREKYGWSVDEELVVVDVDFGGAEIRVLTAYADEPTLIQALKDGLDVHSWVASEIFGEKYEDIQYYRNSTNPEEAELRDKYTTMRKRVKSVNFGLIYGTGVKGLSEDLKISEEEAAKLMAMFFNRFPGIKDYIDRIKAKVRSDNLLRTPTGRARRFYTAGAGGWYAARCERQGINYLVQGFCGEIVIRTMINLWKNLHEIKGRMMLTVHDSMVWEMPKAEVPKLKEFLEEKVARFIEEEFPEVPVSMPYDVEIGPSYGEVN
jgi:uracil-DNA glycosylase family 4